MKQDIINGLDLLGSYELAKLHKNILTKQFHKDFSLTTNNEDSSGRSDLQVELGGRHYIVLAQGSDQWDYQTIKNNLMLWLQKTDITLYDLEMINTLRDIHDDFYLSNVEIKNGKLTIPEFREYDLYNAIRFVQYLEYQPINNSYNRLDNKAGEFTAHTGHAVKVYKNGRVDITLKDVEVAEVMFRDFKQLIKKAWNNSVWHTWVRT